jgi:NADH-quinone oxidoreductase subunit H
MAVENLFAMTSLVGIILLPLASFFLGVIYSYEIRKISARLQSRCGPWLLVPKPLRHALGTTRIFQPLFDILKLLYKESLVPHTAKTRLFRLAPYTGLICLVAAATLVPFAGYSPFASFELSLVAVLYLLLGVPFAFILGGAASSSPWGALGSQREAELMLACETPLAIGAFTTAVMANTLSIQKILSVQISWYPFLILNPFAAAAFLLAIVGKLHLKPFDMPEAEVEIVAGPTTEYSGSLLGIFEIGKVLLISVIVTLFIDLFLAGGFILGLEYPLRTLAFVIEGIVIISLIALIHTLNPRFRIDQALAWYVKGPTVLAAVGLAWAYVLRYLYPAIL